MGHPWLKPGWQCVFLGAAALLALAAAPVHAATQWGSYQWDKSRIGAIQYHQTLSDSNSAAWSTYLDNRTGNYPGSTDYSAINVWSNPLASKYENTNYWTGRAFPVGFTNLTNAPNVNPKKCSPVTYTVEICNASYGNNGWLGVAQIWVSGNLIQQGSVKLNDYYLSGYYNTIPWHQMVICQELAHTLGLSHDDETFGDTNYLTCMDYTSDPAAGGEFTEYTFNKDPKQDYSSTAGNMMPNDNDYIMLLHMYAPPTDTDFCAYGCLNNGTSAPPSGTGNTGTSGPGNSGNHGHNGKGNKGNLPDFLSMDAGNSPAEWGKAVAFYADGRGMVYEHQIAPGQKIVTHVFRTPR